MTKAIIGIGGSVMALILCIPLTFGGIGSTAAASAGTGASAPLGTAHEVPLPHPVFTDVPATGFPTGTFPFGQCTYWAAYNWGGAERRGVTWSGDAWEWIANAAAHGIVAGPSPSVGAIVVYMRGNGYDFKFGHVAVVTVVTLASYTISEMNYLGSGLVDTRTIALPDPHVLGFIPAG